jgi:enoyl-CoA hydratase/carnithine racemase
MLARISRAPAASIASIRGRATGVGSELVLACDMRFASREKAILSQWEVGAGLVTGGGPMARLPGLIGRGRALEVLIGADDIRGDVAELYGYVNWALPDGELDTFVGVLAMRIASFDKEAIADTKRLVNIASLPSDAEIAPEWKAFLAALERPAARNRIKALMERGFHKPGDVENLRRFPKEVLRNINRHICRRGAADSKIGVFAHEPDPNSTIARPGPANAATSSATLHRSAGSVRET